MQIGATIYRMPFGDGKREKNGRDRFLFLLRIHTKFTLSSTFMCDKPRYTICAPGLHSKPTTRLPREPATSLFAVHEYFTPMNTRILRVQVH